MARGRDVLAVVPDPDLLESVAKPLELAGYAVASTATGSGGLTLLGIRRFDLVIVDVGIQDLDQLARGRRLPPTDRPPILCLAPCEILDRLVPELGFGVEDYVTKPCRVTEVLARAHVLLRDRDATRQASLLCYDDLLMDDAVCRAWRGQRALDLTSAEFRLLRQLLLHAEQVLSKEQIARQLWGEARGDNAIERLISRLRQKVDHDNPPLIHTRRGFGYWLGHPSDHRQ
ncbi:response regulator transcription factor [Micromonospora sp. NPDC003197]